MDLLELNERVRLVDRKSGLIQDVICLEKSSKIILALATTVNLPKLFELNEYDYSWINSYFIDIVSISSRSLNKYEVQELTEIFFLFMKNIENKMKKKYNKVKSKGEKNERK